MKDWHRGRCRGGGNTNPSEELNFQQEYFCKGLRLSLVFYLLLAAVELRAQDQRKHRRSAPSKRASGT